MQYTIGGQYISREEQGEFIAFSEFWKKQHNFKIEGDQQGGVVEISICEKNKYWINPCNEVS